MAHESENRDSRQGEGTPTVGGDLVGPGTGGSPTARGTGQPVDREEAARDPEVAAMIDTMRGEGGDVSESVEEAAEQSGTGTDR